MKTKEDILKEIEHIKSDERLKAPCASAFVNTPLALIQLNLESKLEALYWVLSNNEEHTNNG